ncbi:hypothetical protein SPRG_01329 [Saprolegnia parasitica CBS 223.65]|uniref:Uncharacterized protein n=1 Tax=Saprolegnia parasitica (strain CBS 223.65) TaxID=695850 RepID=A0A067CXR6_SAPPC|nr:hypothetical protein SPRG_01329 [Saprolegnia parasitica CBS 223.65]KDO34055.1 hypothetical protein SPRG_01329 [Saprolegnia parasitica CBS 223.65]|eukprot:XP_012194939.1 hypothetical protein SPRG_01329 [Saprolegnia parasitica CBS 223.65]
MGSVAADVLRAPSLLQRICAFHMHASAAPQDLPLRCWSVRLRSADTYAYDDNDDDDDDDHARDRRRFTTWFTTHGLNGLPSLCVPHLFAYATACGDAIVLQWLIDRELVTWTRELLVLDARGCPTCPRAVEDLGPAMKMRSRNVVARAAAKGQRQCLFKLLAMGLTTNEIWKAVCAGGHVDVAEYVVSSKQLDVWDDVYINVAAANGHFELLRFLGRRRPSGINRETIALAITHNQLGTLLELFGLGPSPDLLMEHALQESVKHRRLDILRWLCTQRDARAFFKATRAMAIYHCAPIDIIHCLSDAWSRHVAMQRIRLVFQSKRLVTSIASYQDGVDGATLAINHRCKHFRIYCASNRAMPSKLDYAMYDAAFRVWFARHGVAKLGDLCRPHLFAYAVSYGNVAILNWLKPKSEAKVRIAYFHVVRDAAAVSHLELLQFLLNLGFEMGPAWRHASKYGQLHVVQFLHEKARAACGPEDLDSAAEKGHLNVIRFFHEHDYDGFDKNTIALAVASGNLDLVQFLLAHRKESTPSKAMLAAADKDQLDILRWLCGQPRASRYLEATLQQATTSASRQCIEYLATLPRTAKPTADEGPLKRKAAAVLL